MAVPTVVGSDVAAISGSNDPSFTLDAAAATGDYIYALVMVTVGAFTQQAVTGWTNEIGVTNTQLTTSDNTINGVLMGHEVTSGENGQTTFTITDLFSTVETGEIAAICVRGGDPADRIDGFGSDQQATTGTPFRLAATNVNGAGGTAQTPTVTDGLVIRWLVKDGTGTFTTPAGHTLQANDNTNSAMSIFTRDTAATASTDIANTDVTPDAGDEFLSVTITVPPTGGDSESVTPTDNIGITDSTAQALDSVQVSTDNVGILDSAVDALDNVDSYTDNVGLTDAAVAALDSVQEATDNIGILDTTDVSVGASVETTDNIGVTDSSVAALDSVQIATDNVGITDTATAALASAQDEVDNIGILDTTVAALDSVQAVTDPVGITDTADIVASTLVEETDDVGITEDVLVAVDDVIELDADPIGISDVVELTKVIVDSYVDPVGITDSVLVAAGEGIEIQENVGISDSVVIAVDNVLNIVDAVGISDSHTDALVMVRSVTDALGITDSVVTLDQVGGSNICLEFGLPVFVARLAAVELVDRGVTGTELIDRLAGVATVDRDADVVLQDRTPGAPVLEC